ncbi:Hsp70 family protein [Blastococcus saxobsidens]|uniref:Putative Heat shock protein 70 n=1 Tax=Blastococcus saxobsidens (strain DD2) TaxID=1146883 RepID=H6RJG0_BLASD|nr:Hsp70 family protein [Blastococcus saxobsidens]CCG01073.1 putative Heat shock protein 70 [Blastococcus saxobsidens DD2]
MHREQRSSTREATAGCSRQAGGRDFDEPYALGIDIGDETVTAAVCHPDGTAAPVPVDDAVCAAAAVRLAAVGGIGLIDQADARPRTAAPVTRHLMSRVGVPVPLLVAGHPVQAADLVAAVVAAVQSLAAAQEGRPTSWTVLAVPPSWGPHRQAALTEALAEHATGPVFLASGAVAAARHQLADGDGAGRTVAVYDLGASTLDTAVVRAATNGGPAHVAVPPAPLAWGGRDVDDAVLGHVVAALSGGPRATPEVRAALAGLRAQCVTAKEALSTGTHVRLDVDLPAGTTTLRVVREDLEELLTDDVRSTVDTLRRTVESAGLRVTDLDGVLLVGGAGRMPLVAELLSAELGRPLLVPEDPALALALGAARLGLDALVAGAGAGGGTKPADGDHGEPAAVASDGDDTGHPAAAVAPRRQAVRRPPAARPSRTRSPVAPAGRRSGRRVVVVGGVLVTLLAVPAAFGLPQSRETAGTGTADALAAAEDRNAGWPSSWWPAAAAEAAGDQTGDVTPGTAAAEGADQVTGTSLAAARRMAAPAAADPADEPVRATSGGRPAGGSTGTEDPDVATVAGSPAPAETTTGPSPSADVAPGTPTSPAPTTGTTPPASTSTTSAPPASIPPSSTPPPASTPSPSTPTTGAPEPATPTTSTPPPATPTTTSATGPGSDTGSAPETGTTPETGTQTAPETETAPETAPPAEPTGSDRGTAA